ncbi:MAG: hypothetical protein SGCHY_005353, partial [Lobulomycetales sp.]
PPMLLTYDAPNYFFDKQGGGKVLRVDVDECYSSGACSTTPNSENLRTEFREATEGWSITGPTRTMTVELSVDENSNVRGVVVAQVHGPGPIQNILLMMTPSGDLIVEDQQNQGGDPMNAGKLITNYQLGTRIRLDVIAGRSQVAFKVNGIRSNIVLNSPYDGQYFKAGSYCIQTSDSLSNAVCQVSIYSLEISPPAEESIIEVEGIELEKFHLHIPIRPTVKPPMLLTYDAPNYYFDKQGGGKVLRVDVDQCYTSGACSTTPNTRHLRTEFREATEGWSITGPTRTMSVELSVDESANVKGVVVAQIHGPGPIPNVLLMMTPSGDLIVQDKQNQRGSSINAGNLITNYQLGTKFRLDVIAGHSQVAFKVNGVRSDIVLNSPYDGQYFKAGTYCIQHKDWVSNAVCQVSVYSLVLQ